MMYFYQIKMIYGLNKSLYFKMVLPSSGKRVVSPVREYSFKLSDPNKLKVLIQGIESKHFISFVSDVQKNRRN